MHDRQSVLNEIESSFRNFDWPGGELRSPHADPLESDADDAVAAFVEHVRWQDVPDDVFAENSLVWLTVKARAYFIPGAIRCSICRSCTAADDYRGCLDNISTMFCVHGEYDVSLKEAIRYWTTDQRIALLHALQYLRHEYPELEGAGEPSVIDEWMRGLYPHISEHPYSINLGMQILEASAQE